MDKKEISITLTLAGLTVLFAIASAALFIARGRSAFWTAKKIKIGAAILTLSTLSPSCRPFVTCYDPAPPENEIYLYTESDTILLNDTTQLSGSVENRVSNNFSFMLQNNDSVEMNQTDDITAKDGAFDEYSEEFSIPIDTSLNEGNYVMKLYAVKKEEITPTSIPNNEYQFKFVKGK